jgi:hypothetical protein
MSMTRRTLTVMMTAGAAGAAGAAVALAPEEEDDEEEPEEVAVLEVPASAAMPAAASVFATELASASAIVFSVSSSFGLEAEKSFALTLAMVRPTLTMGCDEGVADARSGGL